MASPRGSLAFSLKETDKPATPEERGLVFQTQTGDPRLPGRAQLSQRRWGLGLLAAAVAFATTAAVIALVVRCTRGLMGGPKQPLDLSSTAKVLGRRLSRIREGDSSLEEACVASELESRVVTIVRALVQLGRHSDPWGPLASASLGSEHCSLSERNSLWMMEEAAALANIDDSVRASATMHAKEAIAMYTAARAIAEYLKGIPQPPQWFNERVLPRMRLATALLLGRQLQQSIQILNEGSPELKVVVLGTHSDLVATMRTLRMLGQGSLQRGSVASLPSLLTIKGGLDDSLEQLDHRVLERRYLNSVAIDRLKQAADSASDGHEPNVAQRSLVRHTLTDGAIGLTTHAISASNSLCLFYGRADLSVKLLTAHVRLAAHQMAFANAVRCGPPSPWTMKAGETIKGHIGRILDFWAGQHLPNMAFGISAAAREELGEAIHLLHRRMTAYSPASPSFSRTAVAECMQMMRVTGQLMSSLEPLMAATVKGDRVPSLIDERLADVVAKTQNLGLMLRDAEAGRGPSL